MTSLQEIKANYRNFDDRKIRRIAEQESKSLRDEVVPILINEIIKRNLGEDLIKWIKAERRLLTQSEIQQIKIKIEKSKCSICGERNKKLKGFRFTTITAFLVSEYIAEYKFIICESCGKRKRRNSAIWTAIFGWWSAGGLFSTPFILMNKIRSLLNEDVESEKIIEAFIQSNIGKITLGGEDAITIELLLRKFNKLENR